MQLSLPLFFLLQSSLDSKISNDCKVKSRFLDVAILGWWAVMIYEMLKEAWLFLFGNLASMLLGLEGICMEQLVTPIILSILIVLLLYKLIEGQPRKKGRKVYVLFSVTNLILFTSLHKITMSI